MIGIEIATGIGLNAGNDFDPDTDLDPKISIISAQGIESPVLDSAYPLHRAGQHIPPGWRTTGGFLENPTVHTLILFRIPLRSGHLPIFITAWRCQ
jgi:hypothetical protein